MFNVVFGVFTGKRMLRIGKMMENENEKKVKA